MRKYAPSSLPFPPSIPTNLNVTEPILATVLSAQDLHRVHEVDALEVDQPPRVGAASALEHGGVVAVVATLLAPAVGRVTLCSELQIVAWVVYVCVRKYMYICICTEVVWVSCIALALKLRLE